jgi:hypothetical protein
VDLNNDGYMDLISGKYNPALSTWFKGSKEGFQNGEIIKEIPLYQKGDKVKDHKAKMSVFKCTPKFVDIDGDKDYDMFVCDFSTVWLNKNIGTPEQPKFGKREAVKTINGNIIGGDSPTAAIVDWDYDGILDIIVSDNSPRKGNCFFTLYKGTKNGLYEEGKPLIEMKEGFRNVPGKKYWICCTDWNNDGIHDLLVGSKNVYIDGEFSFEKNNKMPIIGKLKKKGKTPNVTYNSLKNLGHVYLLLGRR